MLGAYTFREEELAAPPNSRGPPKRPRKQKDPSNPGFPNPHHLGPQNQDVGSLLVVIFIVIIISYLYCRSHCQYCYYPYVYVIFGAATGSILTKVPDVSVRSPSASNVPQNFPQASRRRPFSTPSNKLQQTQTTLASNRNPSTGAIKRSAPSS